MISSSLFDLKVLHSLTHKQIDAGIRKVRDANPAPECFHKPKYMRVPYNLFSSLYLPHKRLYDLITPDNSPQKLMNGLALLAELIGGDVDSIRKTPMLLTAVRSYLKFIIKKDTHGFLEKIMECEPFRNDLIVLFILNGTGINLADENHNHLMQWADCLQETYDAKDDESAEEIIRLISGAVREKHAELLLILKMAALYGVFERYPDILNINCKDSHRLNYILHTAAEVHSEKIVEFMLANGANSDVLNMNNYKPVHLAVIRLIDEEEAYSESFNNRVNVIARLLLSSLRRSLQPGEMISTSQIVDELLKLELVIPGDREDVARALFSEPHKNGLLFSENKLLSLLKIKLQELAHNEIIFGDVFAKGAFGTVKLGSMNGVQVAIKLNEDSTGKIEMREEANIHRMLKHINIVPFICTLERDNCFGIVMKYASGGNLHHFIQNTHPLKLASCMYPFAKQTIAGVEYMHRHKLVHNDLKPGNIFVVDPEKLAEATIVIGDFGSAAERGKTRAVDVTTYFYCAPEGFNPEHPYDYPIDIFSYGITVCEMDTRELPWPANYKRDDIKKILDKGRRPIFNNQLISPNVYTLMQNCCRQRPEDRFTAAQVDDFLDKHFKPQC